MSPLKSLFFLLFLHILFFVTHGFDPLTAHLPDIGEAGLENVFKSLDGINRKTTNSTELVLAAGRTKRKDPSNDFKYYTGGWNISNTHYFYSVAFTAAPLILIATIWLAGCGFSLLTLCFCRCCRRYGFSQTIYAVSLALLSLFTVLTIVGCVVLYKGERKFFNSTTDALQYIVNQANTTAQNLEGVSQSLAAAKNISVSSFSLSPNVGKSISKVRSMSDSAIKILQTEPYRTKQKIDAALDKASLALIIFAAVMLILAIIGLLFSVLGLQPVVYIIVIVGWVLVAGTFILSGVFLALHNVVGDTCVAMDDWVKNPAAHTALDNILPCVNNATAHKILTESRNVTYQLVGQVNKIFTELEDALAYNQSEPLVPPLCNPFNRDLSDRICSPGEVNFTQATKVWKTYVCDQGPGDECSTIALLEPDLYEDMKNVANVSYGINRYGPFLVSLIDCSFVRDTIEVIHRDNCPRLLRYGKLIYTGLVIVSVAVMLSLVFWVLHSRERKNQRSYKLVAPVVDSLGEPKTCS